MEFTETTTIELANEQAGDIEEAAKLVRGDSIYERTFKCTDTIKGDIMTVTATIPDDDDDCQTEAKSWFLEWAQEYQDMFSTARK